MRVKKITITDILRDGIYFYFDENIESQISICMGEALEEAGVPIFSNTNVYKKPYDNNTFLFKKSNNLPKEASLIIVDLSFVDKTEYSLVELPDELIKNQDKIFFICSADSSSYVLPARLVPSTDSRIPIISTHENKFYGPFFNPRIPWGFGIKKAALCRIQKNTGKREKKILRNFVNSYFQDVRNSLDLFLVPHLTDTFEIDYEVNHDNHFRRLSEYLLCLSYCGSYTPNIFHTKHSHFSINYQPSGFFF